MQNVDTQHTRNFALIGHTADGKTSLGEAFLHTAGATSELGKVDDGTSVLDHTPEEKERHHTLTSSLYGFGWNDLHITLVDTPGDPNFQGDGQVALHVRQGLRVQLLFPFLENGEKRVGGGLVVLLHGDQARIHLHGGGSDRVRGPRRRAGDDHGVYGWRRLLSQEDRSDRDDHRGGDG